MKHGEIVLEVTEAVEGGYDARALDYNIFTQGEDWADLKAMVKDAILCHFDNHSLPRAFRLHHAESVRKSESIDLVHL